MKNLNATTGSEILRDLRARFPGIPDKGILAGGAICDWFLGIEPNDIDVFVQGNLADIRLFKTRTANFCTTEVDSYESTLCIAWKSLYKVISSKREGMLNIISCSAEEISPSIILSGFDINATKVAIDIETEELVWDESFAMFLKNRQLKITAMFTPAHTAIRYFCKKDHLNAEGDDDMEMSILISAWTFDRIGNGRYDLAYKFGEAYHQKALKAMNAGMSRYFAIIPLGDGLYTLYAHESYVGLPKLDDKHLDHAMFPVYAPQAFRSQLIDLPKSYIEKINLVRNSTDNPVIHKMMDLFGGSYVRGQVTERAVNTVSAFLKRRPYLQSILLGSSIERQVQIIRRLARFSRKVGPWVYGLAQSKAIPLDLMTDEFFEKLVTRHQHNFTTTLTPSVDWLNLSKNFLWYRIEQVRNAHDLYSEAEKLKIATNSHDQVFKKYNYVFMIKSRINTADATMVFCSQLGKQDPVMHYRVKPFQTITKGSHLAFIWLYSQLSYSSKSMQLNKFFGSVKNMFSNQFRLGMSSFFNKVKSA